MPTFTCHCGFIMRESVDPPEFRGEFINAEDFDTWLEVAAQEIAAFCRASAAGERDHWLAQSPLGHPDYPRNCSDEEIINDLLYATQRDRSLAVYRCPHCSRFYIQTQPGMNSWLQFGLEQRVGTDDD